MAQRQIITDKLLLEKTGKDLQHWYTFLDKKGARTFDHQTIFDVVKKPRA